jgi:hypothetical protein
MKKTDILQPNGHLEIWKVYPDGEEVLYFDEDNTITSGMGVGLGMLYAGSGSTNVLDFQIRYFQLGVGSDATKLATYGTSESVLVSALGQANPTAPGGDAAHGSMSGADYSSTLSNVLIDFHQLMASDGQALNNSEGLGSGPTPWVFGVISDNSIKRVDTNSVTYIIYLDQQTCNIEAPINEIGLFMQNPIGLDPERSQLVAYRPFNDITKTSDFSLVFKWTLNF